MHEVFYDITVEELIRDLQQIEDKQLPVQLREFGSVVGVKPLVVQPEDDAVYIEY